MASNSDTLTENELADRVGASVERIRQLTQLGVLQPDDGLFGRHEVMRARVVNDLESKGIDAESLARALASGHLTLGYVEPSGRRFPRSNQTFSQLAGEMGVSFETLEMFFVAFGLAKPQSDEFVRTEDLPILKALPVLLEAGVSMGDVLRAVRIWGESARRVAQFASHLFHTAMEEPFRHRGLQDNEAYEAALREVGLRMGHHGEEMLAWAYRRHSETFDTAHMFEHVETALEEAGIRQKAPRAIGAAAFADLTGYTRLAEEAGDAVATSVSLSLAQFVSEVAAEHNGEVVKMLGDGVHFHFQNPAQAVLASLQIVDQVGPRGLPPAHIGVNAGPMIYDEGDYFGRTVNIAARIAAKAEAGQVFVGEDLVRLASPEGFQVREVGQFDLKGIAQPVTIFQAMRLP